MQHNEQHRPVLIALKIWVLTVLIGSAAFTFLFAEDIQSIFIFGVVLIVSGVLSIPALFFTRYSISFVGKRSWRPKRKRYTILLLSVVIAFLCSEIWTLKLFANSGRIGGLSLFYGPAALLATIIVLRNQTLDYGTK